MELPPNMTLGEFASMLESAHNMRDAALRENATLRAALHILARVHTGDQPQVGFEVRMGATPQPWECSHVEYVQAWKTVRDHLRFPTEPGEYPVADDEQKARPEDFASDNGFC